MSKSGTTKTGEIDYRPCNEMVHLSPMNNTGTYIFRLFNGSLGSLMIESF